MSKRRNGMRSSSQKGSIVLIAIVLVVLLGKFFLNLALTKTGKETSYSPQEVVSILENTEEVQVCKNYRTIFYKDYSIIVNGENVATVTGKFFHPFGNTFTMYSSDGSIMFSEKEEVLHLNRQAQFYNADGSNRGRYESKYFAILSKDTYKDNSGNFVARCDKKFSIPSKYVAHGEEKEDIFYNVNKQWFFDNYTILKEKDSNLSMDNMVMMICIEDAVSGKSSSSSSSSSSKK